MRGDVGRITRRSNSLHGESHERAIVIDGHSDVRIPVSEGKMELKERPEVPDPATRQPPMGLDKHLSVKFGLQPHTVYFGPSDQYDVAQVQRRRPDGSGLCDLPSAYPR